MAKLKSCKDCGHQISRKAKTCPQCGLEQGRSSWEQLKSLVLLAFVGFVVLLFWNAGPSNEGRPPDTHAASVSMPAPAPSTEGRLIPRSTTEGAAYYLMSIKKDGGFVKTLHKRVSSSGAGYSITRIDCNRQRYQDVGYADGSLNDMEMYGDIRWTELVQGSSKSDLVRFACAITPEGYDPPEA